MGLTLLKQALGAAKDGITGATVNMGTNALERPVS